MSQEIQSESTAIYFKNLQVYLNKKLIGSIDKKLWSQLVDFWN